MYIEVHFGGRFEIVRKKKRYAGGDIKFIKEFDIDKMSWLELRYMFLNFGITKDFSVYHQLPNRKMDDGLVLVENDDDVLVAMKCLGPGQNVIFYIEHLEAGQGKDELLPDYCKINSPIKDTSIKKLVEGAKTDSPKLDTGNEFVAGETTQQDTQDLDPFFTDEVLTQAYDAVMMTKSIVGEIENYQPTVNSQKYLSDELLSQVYDMSMANMKTGAEEKENVEAVIKENIASLDVDSDEFNDNGGPVAFEQNERCQNTEIQEADFSGDENYYIDVDANQKVLWGDSDEDYDGDEDYVPEPAEESVEQRQQDEKGSGEECESETELEKEVNYCSMNIENMGHPHTTAGPSQPRTKNPKKKDDEYIMAGPDCNPLEDLASEYSNSQSLHSVHAEDGEEVNSQHNLGPEYDEHRYTDKDLPELGMVFGSTADFRTMLRNYAITHGKDLFWLKNESTKIIVKCMYEGCPFHAYGGWLDKEKSKFVLKTLVLQHTCGRTIANKQIQASWLAKKYLVNFRDDPKWGIKAFQKTVERELTCELNLSLCYRARRLILDEIEGRHVVQYANLRRYANEILITNPGSTAIIKTEPIPNTDETRFVGIFICLAALIDGLMNDCRPIIGLDGCHLKSMAGGVLLTAVSRDPNNQMFPIAWAVVGVESKETWTWFLDLLRQAIGTQHLRGWTDRQKVLFNIY